MIDPSTPDLTGRVLEALGKLGRRVGDPAVDRAVAYLRSTQEADGSWFGRWGVNYIYGTWQALVRTGGGRRAARRSGGRRRRELAAWPISSRAAAGANRPTATNSPHLRGQGAPTASQTAWAVLGLLAAGMHDHPAVARGVQFLVDQQRDDGTWDETGIHRHRLPPRVLPALPLLPDLLPAAGAWPQWAVRSSRWPRNRRRRCAACSGGRRSAELDRVSAVASAGHWNPDSHRSTFSRFPGIHHAISLLADQLDDRLPASQEAGRREDVSRWC